MTNAPHYNIAFLDARHRARRRCENRIKTLKNTGLGKFPCFSYTANEAWANLTMFAMCLVSWIGMAILPSVHPTGFWDVKRWRYRLFLMAGKLVRGGRQPRLLLPVAVPEAELAMDLPRSIARAHQHFRYGNPAA